MTVMGDRPSFTCPRCGRTSWNKMDVSEGYCGHCHDWTDGRRHTEDPFNRDESGERPGLRVHAVPIDASKARSLTYVGTESSAAHSRSKGWLPVVALSLSHVPLADTDHDEQRLMLILTRSDVELLIEHLSGGLRGAIADAAAGPVEGTDAP